MMAACLLSGYSIQSAEIMKAEKIKPAQPKPDITKKVSKPSSCGPFNEGTVKFFDATKGYGFIKDKRNGGEIMVHISGLIDQPVKASDAVCFETVQGKKGLNAVNVRLKE